MLVHAQGSGVILARARCAARAAAAVSAVRLGPVKTVTPVKVTTDKRTISQNKKFGKSI
jgi:hypothetical protein